MRAAVDNAGIALNDAKYAEATCQKWIQQANGSLLNPQSGRCLDDPSDNTANGVRLQIWDCNNSAAQVFDLN